MSVASNRSVILSMTGDVEYTQQFDAVVNSAGSGQNQLVNLSSGANTITVPSGAVAVTIIPPAANAVAMTLKGVAGDTGIALSLLAPSSISLLSVSSFVINAASAITGVRFIYS